MKHCGVYECDQFFNRCQQLVEGFGSMMNPVKAAQKNFYETTGFWEQAGASKLFRFNNVYLRA